MSVRLTFLISAIFFSGSLATAAQPEDAPPKVGQAAPDFELAAVAGTLEGQVKLSDVLKEQPVAMVVLRGYPGYQCGICGKQASNLVSRAADFKKRGVSVLMIYPGPAADLDKRAMEFLNGTELPAGFTMLIDPDYEFTNAYNLRWNAPRETAYPATYVIGQDGEIDFAKVSDGHAGRTNAKEILAAIE